MKKEFTSALLSLTDSALPANMAQFTLLKKSGSEIAFVDKTYAEQGLHMFVILQPSAKWHEIDVDQVWAEDGSVPLRMILDARSLEFKKNEHELLSNRLPLKWAAGDSIRNYSIVPCEALDLDTILMLSQTIEPHRALEMVTPVVKRIRHDLEVFATDYFAWLIRKKFG